MPATTAQQVFRDLEKNEARPICLVVGEEPFQAAEIEERFRKAVIRTEDEAQFNLELWDGEHLDASKLLNSLNTLPGLFAEAASKRLVVLKQFERVSAAALEQLESYCEAPSPDAFLLIFAAKVDRRRAVFKAIEAQGSWIEICEPYEREWPKWQPYFERKCGKRIELDAWEMLVAANRSLSLVWADILRLSVYVGEVSAIKKADVVAFSGSVSGVDVFSFVDDVVNRRARVAIEKFHHLLLSGESEIKLLALLVRQFRHLDQVKRLTKSGVVDPQAIASFIGVHRFGVSALIQSAKRYSEGELKKQTARLSAADYRMKLGGGGLFENFLVGFFSR
ncbi:MAG: DNA polymerase III subunit delta [Deltaproteobacteria bacterium]|nr:DNA polymerase III subunit delta [Deltaproteobacteria bacterium]MBI3295149.1 DNA polymerase III subunit delta [Deltaproteobacteria bacterium]